MLPKTTPCPLPLLPNDWVVIPPYSSKHQKKVFSLTQLPEAFSYMVEVGDCWLALVGDTPRDPDNAHDKPFYVYDLAGGFISPASFAARRRDTIALANKERYPDDKFYRYENKHGKLLGYIAWQERGMKAYQLMQRIITEGRAIQATLADRATGVPLEMSLSDDLDLA